MTDTYRQSAHRLALIALLASAACAGDCSNGNDPMQRLSDRMMASWLAFTRTGDPSIEGERQAWPAYELQRRPTMVFESGLEDAPYDEERAAWDDLTARAL